MNNLLIKLSNGMTVEMPRFCYVVQIYAGGWVNDSAFVKKEDAETRYNYLDKEGYQYIRIEQFL